MSKDNASADTSAGSGIVQAYGRMWARNARNVRAIAQRRVCGVYVLFDGSMPVYLGRGDIAVRLERHGKDADKREAWDHFSWAEIPDKRHRQDIEALLLRLLPHYLRSLNRKKAEFFTASANKGLKPPDRKPRPIRRDSLPGSR